MKESHTRSSSSAHHRWMEICLGLAENALPEDVPVGAILLYEGEIIAQACNWRERDQNPVGHAEISVLQEASKKLGRWRLTNTTLVVTLEPCPMCASAILQARVAQVVFGAYDPLMGACGSKYHLFNDARAKTRITGGVLEGPCAKLLRDFFRGTGGQLSFDKREKLSWDLF